MTRKAIRSLGVGMTTLALVALIAPAVGHAQQPKFESLPDWSGIWQMQGGTVFDAATMTPKGVGTGTPNAREFPPYTPEFEKLYLENIKKVADGTFPDPVNTCGTPHGWPRAVNLPDVYEFVVRPEQTWILGENGPAIVRIYTDGRKHPVRVPEVHLPNRRRTWKPELEDCQPSSSSHDPCQLAARQLGPLDVADPEGHRRRLHRIGGDRDCGSIAANQHDSSIALTFAHFGEADAQHLVGKIDANRPRRPAPPTRHDRHISCPRTQVEERLLAGQPERLDSAPTPPLIETGAEQAIQQIVPPGDGVEHAGNAVGCFCPERVVDDVVSDGLGRLGNHGFWFRRQAVGIGRGLPP